MENRANIPILRKIIFGIVVSILLLATIASMFLMVNHAAGFFVEGMIGFVCEIVFRVFFIILTMEMYRQILHFFLIQMF